MPRDTPDPSSVPTDLLALQRTSFGAFVQADVDRYARERVGLERALREAFPITSFGEDASLELDHYWFADARQREDEARRAGGTYARDLRVTVRLVTWDVDPATGERTVHDLREQDLVLGEVPWMTSAGTFLVDGVERVVQAQLARCPGPWLHRETDPDTGRVAHVLKIEPRRGPTLTFRVDHRGRFTFQSSWAAKLPAATFLRATGYTTEQLLARFYEVDRVKIAADGALSLRVDKDALVGRRALRDVRAGGEVLVKSGRRYTRAALRKLLAAGVEWLPLEPEDVVGRVAARDAVGARTGEVYVEAARPVSEDALRLAAENGVDALLLVVTDQRDRPPWLCDALARDADQTTEDALLAVYARLRPGDHPDPNTARLVFARAFFEPEGFELSPAGRQRFAIALDAYDTPLHGPLTREDVLGAVAMLHRRAAVDDVDDPDHLHGAAVYPVGALLEERAAMGLRWMSWRARERLSLMDPRTTLYGPADMVSPRPLTDALREFFKTARVCRRADQTNPLALLAQKRWLASVEPNARSQRRTGFLVRDAHPSHYGILCPVEAAEGAPDRGAALALHARINAWSVPERPVRRVLDGAVEEGVAWLGPHWVLRHAPFDALADGRVPDGALVLARDDYRLARSDDVTTADAAPDAAFGVCAALVPFARHDDPRALGEGVRNLKRALPLVRPRAPGVATGREADVAAASELCVRARRAGRVERVDGRAVTVRARETADEYALRTFEPTGQTAWLHQRPAVREGDVVAAGDVLAAAPAMEGAALALGREVLAAVMCWDGWNDEAAVVVSERVVREGRFTSGHVREVSCLLGKGARGATALRPDAPGVTPRERAALTAEGLARVGRRVRGGDVLAARVLVRADDGATEDATLRVPPGVEGVVIRAEVADPRVPGGGKRRAAERPRAVFWLASQHPLEAGDVLGTRHGARGAVSRVVPEEDLPLLPDGRAVELVLNPRAVLDPTAAGLVLEMLAGMGDPRPVPLRDGRTGEAFARAVCVGPVYAMKLAPEATTPLPEARSRGARDLVTMQPRADGRSHPGQEVGEGELWALVAHGAAHALREFLTARSDDPRRAAVLDRSIEAGAAEDVGGAPHGLYVLFRELQALGLVVAPAVAAGAKS